MPAASALAAYGRGEVPPALIDFGRHAFTFGFLTQMIIGVALRILPALSGAALWSSAWRDATFWLLNGTVALRGLQVVVAFGGPPVLWPFTAVSGVLGVAAFVAFTVNLAMTLRGAGGSGVALLAESTGALLIVGLCFQWGGAPPRRRSGSSAPLKQGRIEVGQLKEAGGSLDCKHEANH